MDMPFNVVEIPSIFCDAYVRDAQSGQWLFGSFWGHETSCTEFMAKMMLPNHDDGLSSFTLRGDEGDIEIAVGKADALKKLTAKTPKDTVLGSICNLWVYHPALIYPSRESKEGYVVSLEGESEHHWDKRLWSVLQDITYTPLMGHWRDALMPMLFARDWILPVDGFGVEGYRIKVDDDELGALVGELLRDNTISTEVMIERGTDVFNRKENALGVVMKTSPANALQIKTVGGDKVWCLDDCEIREACE